MANKGRKMNPLNDVSSPNDVGYIADMNAFIKFWEERLNERFSLGERNKLVDKLYKTKGGDFHSIRMYDRNNRITFKAFGHPEFSFFCMKLNELPLNINAEDPHVRAIVNWRIGLGK